MRGSPSTDPKGASSKPGSLGSHPTGAQVSTSSRSVDVLMGSGSHASPAPVLPHFFEPPLGLPARPFAEIGSLPHRDRSYSAPRPVRGARRAPAPPQSESPRSSQHHAPLRQHRRTATSRRFSPRAAAPAAVKAYGWSSRPGAASLEDPSGSRQGLIGRYRAGSSSARSVGPHARARAPRPRRTPRGGTPLGITDPHERPRTDDERRVQRQRAFVA